VPAYTLAQRKNIIGDIKLFADSEDGSWLDLRHHLSFCSPTLSDSSQSILPSANHPCVPLSLAVIVLGGAYGLELNMWKHSPLSCVPLSLAMIELGGVCSFECVKKNPPSCTLLRAEVVREKTAW